jgi:hypothetical protein
LNLNLNKCIFELHLTTAPLLIKNCSNKVVRIGQKIGHRLMSRKANGHGVHSPYLYGFMNRVLNNPYPYYAFDKNQTDKTISSTNKILFRLVNEIQPRQILELNAHSNESSRLMLKAFHSAQCNSIVNTTEHIPNDIAWDLVVFHSAISASRSEQDIQQILQTIPENSIFVFTNKNHNAKKTIRWKTLRQHPRVVVSIDLYFMGILFFKPELPKKEYVIRIKDFKK